MRKLIKDDFDYLEEQVRAGKMSRQAVANIIKVPATVVCRWVADGRSLWERYLTRKKRAARGLLTIRTIETPEWGVQTYTYCAERLKINPPSFAKRVRKYGKDDPRTWVEGKLGRAASATDQNVCGKNSEWGNLGGKPRDHMLKNIPEPTKYERRMYGMV
jgi:hypothetical protein